MKDLLTAAKIKDEKTKELEEAIGVSDLKTKAAIGEAKLCEIGYDLATEHGDGAQAEVGTSDSRVKLCSSDLSGQSKN